MSASSSAAAAAAVRSAFLRGLYRRPALLLVVGGTVVALNDINLTIRDGDVYGIIGMSGAGKSTLVRCINMLERPDEGNVIVNGKQMQDLRAADLEGARANMKVLHPLPRIDEITTDVDKTPHAWYFQQAGNGIFARQALLALVLNRELAL